MHFIIAAILLFLVYAAVGIPSARPVIQQIVPDSPAQHSDFRVGDRIVAVNGVPVKTWEDIPSYVQSHGESELVFTVIHKGSSQRADIVLKPRAETVDGKQVPRVGIGPEQFLQTKPVPSALSTTVTEMPKFMWETIKALGGLFSPNGIENYGHLLTGSGGNNNNRLLSPYGAARVASEAVDNGWGAVLMFLFAINIFVGIFNMVPLLPLDGGHVAIATYEKIASSVKRRRVQVDVQKLMPITAAVLAFLVILGLSALYLDIFRPVSGP
jgi:membrane-associated protease RseP (regulator of RpoE activity)